MKQPNLFVEAIRSRPLPEIPRIDPVGARDSADEAIERVERAADPEWKAACYAIAERFARSRATFTSMDIHDATIEAMGRDAREGRLLGAVMRHLSKHHLATQTGHYAPSLRRRNNNRPAPIWRSLVFWP